VAAGVLIGLGSLSLAAGLYAPFNKTITSEKRDSEFAACLAFGAPLTLGGIWIFKTGFSKEIFWKFPRQCSKALKTRI
jgi:hypothetical protein